MKPFKRLSKAVLTPLVLALIAVFALSGCVNATRSTTDPNTGKTTVTTYKTVDPNVVAKLNKISDMISALAPPVAAGGSLIWPGFALIAGLAGGAAAAWKKYSDGLAEAKDESTLYYNTITSIATGVENFKKSNPVEWETLKKTLSDTIGKKAEAVIDGVRDSITGKIA